MSRVSSRYLLLLCQSNPDAEEQNEGREPEITYPQSPVSPTVYFAPDEIPDNPRMMGVVHELQYIEDEIGEFRRRSSAWKKAQAQEMRRASASASRSASGSGSGLGPRRRSSVQPC
jgi:hypothetical protein